MKLEVEITGVAELKKNIAKLGDEFTKYLEAAVMAGALPVQNAAKEKAPYKTGTLRRSIHMETKSKSPERVEVAVGTDVVYAAIQEFGGTITPKRAKMLRFVIGGQEIFAKRVQIPPHPYLRPALDEKKNAAIDEMGAALKQILERVDY